MIIKVTKNKNEKDKADGGELSRKEIWEMVQHHRKEKNPKDLKYAHFNLKDILTLFINNEVLPSNVAALLSQSIEDPKIKKHGVKVYIGRHAKKDTCPTPAMGSTLKKEDYIGKATTIIVNTNLEKVTGDPKRGFRDMLTSPSAKEEFYVLIPGMKEDGIGIDKAEIEPPYHEGEDDDKYHDIGGEKEEDQG